MSHRTRTLKTTFFNCTSAIQLERTANLIVDSVLANAKAYLNREVVDCSIAIQDGRIFKIGKETHMPSADEKTDLQEQLVLPGLIDAHVHLRDEEKAYKEDFYTGTAASAAGGFTTVLDMPNNDPVTDSAFALKNRMQIAERKILVDVGFYSEFPNDKDEIPGIVHQGAVAFKLFMGNQVGGLDIDSDEELLDALRKTGDEKVTVAVHAEDKSLLTANVEKMKRANRNDSAAFLKAHSEEVEVTAIKRLLETSKETNVHLHFCHLTSEGGMNAAIEAKKSGRAVTCEVTPNHLLLSDVDVRRCGSLLIMMPPLRSESHVEALWNGIAEGWVDTLGSDHAPHTRSEKSASIIWEVKVGVPGLETTLPLMLTMVRKNRLSLEQMVHLLAERPAEIFNLKDRGWLEQGKKADLTVVDYRQKFKIDASIFHSKAKFSPYDGWEVQGKPVRTYLNGLLIMENQDIIAKAGSGRVIQGDTA
jgi:dihydroorotase